MPDPWFAEEHTEQRQACGVPQDLVFKTKPEIGLELLKSAIQRDNLSFSWVAADALYGDSPAFRDGVAATGKSYFTAIKDNTLIWSTPPKVHVPPGRGHGRHPSRLRLSDPRKRPIPVHQLVKKIQKRDWVQAVIKEGSKGPIVCDFAFLRVTELRGGLPTGELWLKVVLYFEPSSAAIWMILPRSNIFSPMLLSTLRCMSSFASAECDGPLKRSLKKPKVKSGWIIMRCAVG